MGILKNFFNKIIPGGCIICKTPLSYPEKYICKTCNTRFSYITPPYCSICMKKFYSLKGVWKCGMCTLKSPDFERVISPFDYENPEVKKIILSFKIGGKDYLSGFLADSIYRFCEKLEIVDYLKNFDRVIPVPTSSQPYLKRLFNPPAEIAKKIARILNINLDMFTLLKTRDIPSQSTKNTKEKFENVKGVFYVQDDSKIKDKDIILIDDVVTSTATIREVSKILKRGECGKIVVLCAARA